MGADGASGDYNFKVNVGKVYKILLINFTKIQL